MKKPLKIDAEKTKRYYSELKAEQLCDCAYCKAYYRQINTAYPHVAAYLASLGIDAEKPFETSPLGPDEHGMLEYCACQYIAFGCCSPEYRHNVGEVSFRLALSYPSTGIAEEHFVLEFSPIRLHIK